MERKSGSLIEWIAPTGFILTFGWVVWHMPAFILVFGGQNDQLAALLGRIDVAPNLPVVIGNYIDIADVMAVVGAVVLLVIGLLTLRRAPMEYESTWAIDRLAVFVGRITMILVVLLTGVMIFEVIARYVFEAPTLWANELSLWLAGFVFLCAGLYAMQQRSHIRIFLLYDVLPRPLQHACDILSTTLIVVFAFFLIYGGYGEAFAKFGRWETFGTVFDPPIPATLKPLVLFIVAMVAVQAVINLIADWHLAPVKHTAADDIDQDELARLRRAVGDDGVGEKDVTRGSVQSKTGQN